MYVNFQVSTLDRDEKRIYKALWGGSGGTSNFDFGIIGSGSMFGSLPVKYAIVVVSMCRPNRDKVRIVYYANLSHHTHIPILA